MIDTMTETESLRYERCREIAHDIQAAQAAGATEDDIRAALKVIYGETWTTSELQRDFDVLGFSAPFVVVCRKADGQKGSLEFCHAPRTYYGFRAHTK